MQLPRYAIVEKLLKTDSAIVFWEQQVASVEETITSLDPMVVGEALRFLSDARATLAVLHKIRQLLIARLEGSQHS